MAANGDEDGRSRLGDLVPRPDPTVLTTAQLNKEIASLREIIEARLDAMDKATQLRFDTITRRPTEVEKEINHARELRDQKFAGVDQQFRERDIRFQQIAIANKEALDAALAAAKELISVQNQANTAAAAKTEATFTKQIDQTAVLIAALEKGINGRIDELKERLDRGEGHSSGISASWGILAAVIGIAIAVVSLIRSFMG